MPPNHTTDDDSTLYNAERAAARLDMPLPRFLDQHRRPRGLPEPLPRGVKIGRRLYWRRSDLDAWVARAFDRAQAQR